MQDKIRELVDNLGDRWRGLERGQKMRLGLGGLLLILAISATLYFTLRPDWVNLFTNRDITTLSGARAVLNDAGINYRITDGGRSLAVMSRDEFAARAVISEHPEVGGLTFFDFQDYIDSVGFGVSEAVRRDMSLMAEQNRIANAIRGMAGITDATVWLNIPEERNIIFGTAPPATASVLINHVGQIDHNSARAIAELVASAVPALEVENVTVTNQLMQTLFSGDIDPMTSTITSDFEMELTRRNMIQMEVQRLVGPHFDDVRVLSNIVVNTNQRTSEMRIPILTDVDGNTGALHQRITSQEQAQSTGGGGEPGLGSNDQASAQYQIGAQAQETNANRRHTEEHWEHGWEYVFERYSFGDLVPELSSIAIIGYRQRTFSQAHMEDNDLLNGQTWAEFVEERRSIPLDITDTLPPALIASISMATGIDNVSFTAFELPVFQPRVITPFNWELLVVFALLVILLALLFLSLFRRSQTEEVLEVAPELSVEDLLVSTQLEEEVGEPLKDIDYNEGSDIKRQIDKFVEDRPEAVAQLLRNWLNEGWE
ncbi:MAG: hypothetical protein FWE24_05225 [Defluviitaleaceae bacterium]|nr:hypothetical protein [Defluviitaleaceae bacterium]